jgi:hypothetical protein
MMSVSAVMAELVVTPYGAVQYRLRAEFSSYTFEGDADDLGTFDYSNRLCLRFGMRAEFDEQFSAHFRIGNDWGSPENVNFGSNRNGSNLYLHLAYFRWNPGPAFLEAGIVPLRSHGALDLFERSIRVTAGGNNRYVDAIINGWANQNHSMAGLKLGMPILKREDINVSMELFQSVLDPRIQSVSRLNADSDPALNPAAVILVLSMPIGIGSLNITPQFVGVPNRFYTSGLVEEGEHEFIFGLAGSYKFNSAVTLTFKGAYGMVDNGNAASSNDTNAILFKDQGMLFGLGATVKVGPGNIQFAIDYNHTEDTEKDLSDVGYLWTDLRYAWKFHPRVTFTPRYRTYTRMFNVAVGGGELKTRFGNRFELIVEGSF